ncbi:DNA primase [Helicobacter cholecystus]|uniref:DNA primase n=1 Tax=Helicobacter cholecystus TaxID=45498 RepID=A0A3D8IX73_9HELI|nr:DNA primase [Helicobacter cholecystus]RDU69879.1 DNA primase [Helicobacter cholecystus]VEJ25738.1 DNA primase [Helicobacter cholecystus]
MITKESIESLKNSLDIVSIISSYIPLKRSGINYSACCPFHGEKTPSFMVSPSRGTYHCFGCGVGGDAFSFVMEYEKLSFAESVEKVAALSGFTLTYTKDRGENIKKESSLLESFATFYANSLASSPTHLSYFKERGITSQSIAQFKLGYCGAGFLSINFADSLNARKEAIELGVLGENESRVYARFSERVIFPIHSANGKVVGFGGRVIQSDSKLAKYLNSPQSKVFNKSKLLYAYHLAKESIFSKKEIIITEGYIDVIALHQAGIKNAVATLGTALTPEHLPLLNRGEPKIIVGYDGDKAGINSATKASKLLASEGKEGGVVIFPNGADPADMVTQGRIEELKVLFASPIPFVRFALEQIAYSYDLNDVFQKEKALKEGREFFSTLSAIVQRTYFASFSAIFKVPPEFIRVKKSKVLQVQSQISIYNNPLEVMIITTMYEKEELLEWAIEYLEKDHFLECKSEYEALLANRKEDSRLQALLSSANARVAHEEEFKKQVLLKVCKENENKIQKIISSNELDYDTKLKAITQLQQKIQQIKKEL